jgi:MFS-type transporter involved in bile tolerance (Atg22 family)
VGALRLGELRVFDHRHGRILSDLVQTILERRRRRGQSSYRLGARTRSSLVIALVAPALGAVADAGGSRKRFPLASAVVGIVATAALFWVGRCLTAAAVVM